jgi:hypothetical protein
LYFNNKQLSKQIQWERWLCMVLESLDKFGQTVATQRKRAIATRCLAMNYSGVMHNTIVKSFKI